MGFGLSGDSGSPKQSTLGLSRSPVSVVSVGLGGSTGEITSGRFGLVGSVCSPMGFKYSLTLQVFSCRFRLSARLNFFKQ